jgi:hypothetical protein
MREIQPQPRLCGNKGRKVKGNGSREIMPKRARVRALCCVVWGRKKNGEEYVRDLLIFIDGRGRKERCCIGRDIQ